MHLSIFRPIMASPLLVVLLIAGCAEKTVSVTDASTANADRAQRFASPQDAVDALVEALRPYDRTALLRILGPDGEALVASGDPVADRQAIDAFLAQYGNRRELVQMPDGSVQLEVGEEHWPLPIPLVEDEPRHAWYFDTAAGKDEMLSRRIGRNELATIQTCLALVEAQREYAAQDPDGNGRHDFAQKLLSDPGSKNGLFWATSRGEPPSPIGPLVAQATREGYTFRRTEHGQSQPYHGYIYRLLTSQGPAARGGAKNYMVNGDLAGGFAVVAYPAEYGASGIMTFIVSNHGLIYQRDLGEKTETLTADIQTFNPTVEWQLVESAALVRSP